MKIISRPYCGMDDFNLVRLFLTDTYPITPPDFNWNVRRWDGSFYHNEKAGFETGWGRFPNFGIQLWETDSGELVGVVHTESARGDAHIDIHPDFRHIEEEMIVWAESNLAIVPDDDPRRKIYFFVYEYDDFRKEILARRGYEKVSIWGVIRRLTLDGKDIQGPKICDGYKIRNPFPDDINDCQRYADALNGAFGREYHSGKELETFRAGSPSYRYNLDIVAEAPDGSIASLAALTYDEEHRFGLFEPVATHPDHTKKGLAKALMLEGIRRVKDLGAERVYVATGDQVAANALYESVGFTEVWKGYYWKKLS